MKQTIEAVYKNGVLTPLEPLSLPDDQRVRITIDLPESEEARKALRAWQEVYDGLSDEEVDEVERIALDRTRFMRDPRG